MIHDLHWILGARLDGCDFGGRNVSARAAKLALLVVLGYQGERLTIAQFAAVCGMSDRQANNALLSLHGCGLIGVIGMPNQPKRYYPNIAAIRRLPRVPVGRSGGG